MSAREPITELVVARLLIGVTPGDWRGMLSSIKRGGMLVAPSGIVGGIRNEADLAFVERAPDIAEWALRELRLRDRQMAEKDRRIAELEAGVAQLRHDLDEATRTEDPEETFAQEHERALRDVSKEH